MQPLNYACDREFLAEHWHRAAMFLNLARNATKDRVVAFRFLVAAIYSCAAIADQLLGAAKEQGGEDRRAEIDQQLTQSVKYYRLVDDARVHDFHRITLMPPVEGRVGVMLSGPIKMISRQGGTAAIFGVGADQQIIEERNSTVKQDRPLQQQDDALFDYEVRQFVPMATIVHEYLRTIGPLIDFHAPAAPRSPANGDPFDGAPAKEAPTQAPK